MQIKAACCEAYLQLLAHHSPNDILVKQIVQQANISRSSFYVHFQNRKQLHTYVQQQLDALFFAHYSQQLPADNRHRMTLLLCQHILKYRAYYVHTFQHAEEIQRLSLHLSELLTHVYDDNDYAIFAGFGTIGYLQHWVAAGFDKSPSDVAEKLLKIGFTNWSGKVQHAL